MAVVITYNNKIINFDNVPYVQPGISFDGLVLYLDANNPSSYPSSGNIWYDLTTNNNDGTISGPVYNVSGNGSFYFSITNTDKVDCGSEIGKMNIQQVTVSMWIKPTQPTGLTNYLIHLDYGGSGSPYYGVSIVITDKIDDKYYLISNIGDGVWRFSNNRKSTSTNDRVIIRNVWQMVTVVYTSAQSVKIYLNGVEITNLSTSGSYNGATIGWSNGAGKTLLAGGSLSEGFNGYMNDVEVYSRALTQAEVVNMYNIQSIKYL